MFLVTLYLQPSLHWSSCFRYEMLLNNRVPKHLSLLVFPPCSSAAVLQLPESSTKIRSRPYPQQGRSQSLGSSDSVSCAGRCRLQKQGVRLCDDFLWITSVFCYNLTFHCFVPGIKPQRTLYRRKKNPDNFHWSLRMSLVLVLLLSLLSSPWWGSSL